MWQILHPFLNRRLELFGVIYLDLFGMLLADSVLSFMNVLGMESGTYQVCLDIKPMAVNLSGLEPLLP